MCTLRRLELAAAILVLAGCTQPPAADSPDTRAADAAAIRAAAIEWSAAAGAKDAERFASFYAEDAVLMLEAAPDADSEAAIRATISGLMQDPNFALSFTTADVVVARAGDIAYETGSYELTLSGVDGAPATQQGHFVVVWRKQDDGGWKVVIDAPISDPSAPAQ